MKNAEYGLTEDLIFPVGSGVFEKEAATTGRGIQDAE